MNIKPLHFSEQDIQYFRCLKDHILQSDIYCSSMLKDLHISYMP